MLFFIIGFILFAWSIFGILIFSYKEIEATGFWSLLFLIILAGPLFWFLTTLEFGISWVIFKLNKLG